LIMSLNWNISVAYCHGTMIVERRSEKDSQGFGRHGRFKKMWTSKEISAKTKFSILKACIFSILLYASESWTLRKRDKDKLMAFEMRCYTGEFYTSDGNI